MSGMILCRSEYSKRPYYIAGAAANVYSIEEICYFLYHDIYLVGADFFCEELFSFIEKDIKEPELARRLRFLSEQRAGLSELVLTVLRYVDFYTEEEIRQLGNLIERLDTQNVWERLKARADNYLSNRRYNSAIRSYEDIVYGKHDGMLGEAFYGNVWHNMGVAYARRFDFTEACGCFRHALELNHNEETQKAYHTAVLLSRQKSEAAAKEPGQDSEDGEEDEEDELMYVAGRELETYMDNAVNTESYRCVAEVLQCKKDKRVGEYYSGVERLIAQWQEEYRSYIK